MVVSEVVLHNFGVFRGRHAISLSPPAPDKPVILFGGQNGAGKSTLLEGFQHALYGKLAPRHRTEPGGYDDYLRRAIHRSERPDDGASVEVAFRYPDQGQEREQRVRRSWSVRGTRVVESLQVLIDGQANQAVSEAWTEQVNHFIPPSLSQLFFFDGERVEALADPSSSAAILATAIDALLGMDLVTQLQTDLVLLERRRVKTLKGPASTDGLAALEEQLRTVTAQLAETRERQARLRNDLDRHAKLTAELDGRFQREGGDLLEQRTQVEQQLAQLERDLKELTLELTELAAADLPLVLVQDLLAECAEQAALEEAQTRELLVAAELAQCGQRLLDLLTAQPKVDAIVLGTIREFFGVQVTAAQATQRVSMHLALPEVGRLDLRQLLTGAIDREKRHGQESIGRWEECRCALEATERRLAAVPDSDAIAALVAQRHEGRQRQQVLTREMDALTAELGALELVRGRINDQLNELARAAEEAAFCDYESQRFLKHTRRARATLADFHSAAVRQHAGHLQELILQGYGQLLHKRSLLSAVSIDPATCALALLGADNTPIAAETLSAGERQLLAVSILWALAKASGRPLPVVIDTPLSRLDAAHRSNLVQRYFPFASHQVLLLSTDEEIDRRYYSQLKPWIGRTYLLSYQEEQDTTSVTAGYFWEE